LLKFYAANATDPKLIGGTVTKQGNLVILNIGDDPNSNRPKFDMVNRYEFDTAKGGNLVRYFTADGGGSEETRIELQVRSDVFVPSLVSFEVKRADGHLAKRVVFSNIKVNQPIPLSTFTLRGIGLQDGDTISDRVSNVDYELEQGTDPTPETTQPSSEPKNP
jgi:hypothetical protein